MSDHRIWTVFFLSYYRLMGQALGALAGWPECRTRNWYLEYFKSQTIFVPFEKPIAEELAIVIVHSVKGHEAGKNVSDDIAMELRVSEVIDACRQNVRHSSDVLFGLTYGSGGLDHGREYVATTCRSDASSNDSLARLAATIILSMKHEPSKEQIFTWAAARDLWRDETDWLFVRDELARKLNSVNLPPALVFKGISDREMVIAIKTAIAGVMRSDGLRRQACEIVDGLDECLELLEVGS